MSDLNDMGVMSESYSRMLEVQKPPETTCARCNGERRVRNSREEARVVGEDFSDCPDCTGLAPSEHGEVEPVLIPGATYCNIINTDGEHPWWQVRTGQQVLGGWSIFGPMASTREEAIAKYNAVFALQSQVAKLREERDTAREYGMDRDADIAALQPDAGRYRWLRDYGVPEMCITAMGLPTYIRMRTAEVDAAIDALISEFPDEPIDAAIDAQGEKG